MKYQLYPLGDHAIIVEFGSEIDRSIYKNVQYFSAVLEKFKPEWLIEYIPTYTTITLFYNPLFFVNDHLSTILPYEIVSSDIQKLLSKNITIESAQERLIEIPVCYGGSFGPDLSFVAEHNQLTEEEVIRIHSSSTYIVYMLGFAPGFPFIGGMSPKISTPRRDTPRLKIPSRSVGIAGNQTGIYPIETPGGWQLIGKTPLHLFQINHNPPTLLQAGDQVRFKPISEEEYYELEKALV